MYNCAPPKLLFTNAGNRSPQDFIHDQYGIPALVETPTIANENLMQSNDVRWWNYSGSTSSERLARTEKHFLYGTIVEECMHWMEQIAERHSFQLTTTGLLEDWIKPDYSAMNPPQENGSQLDNYSLHNPDFWFVYLKNLYTIQRYGRLLEIEKEFILKRLLAAEFPRKEGDLDNEYHQTFWTSQPSDYFASGKIDEEMMQNWLFPFELTKEIEIATDNYFVESFHEDYDPESPGSEYTDLLFQQFDFYNGGLLNEGISCFHTRNVTGGESNSYYQYGISLVRLPYRIDRQIVNDPSVINNFLGPYVETPRRLTLRNACGFYGATGRNAAIAFNVKTRDASVYGDDTLLDVPLDGFRVGIIWLDCENNPTGFPHKDNPNGNPSFNLLEMNANTTWLEEDLQVGINIINFPDDVLDYVPDEWRVPFLIFSPPNQPVAEDDRIYHLFIDTDISNLDITETTYLHNYPMKIGDDGVMRYCTDDYLMSFDSVIQ